MRRTRFFDEYPRFYESSNTGSNADRLNTRHEAIIAGNRETLAGRRVLDLASHDGRWSFAALKAGAAHVTGIEARAHLIRNAAENFSAYGVSPDRYRFKQGDVFEVLRAEDFDVDVILCLGFFYHIIQHVELVKLFAETNAETVILDTEIVPRRLVDSAGDRDPADRDRLIWRNPFVIQLLLDPVEQESMAVASAYTRQSLTVVGRPSAQAVQMLFRHFGFRVDEVDFRDLLEPADYGLDDYAQGWRAAFLARR